MTRGELMTWAEGIVAADPCGRSVIAAEVAPAVLLQIYGEQRDLTAAYHDLCAVLGWAVDDKPATAEMVARAAKAVAKQYPAFRSYPAQA